MRTLLASFLLEKTQDSARITLGRETGVTDGELTNYSSAGGDVFGLMENVYRSGPFTLRTLLGGGGVTHRSSAASEKDRCRQEDGDKVEAVAHDWLTQTELNR